MLSTLILTIGLGTQFCTKEDNAEYCTATEYKTAQEKIELEGNQPWQKEFSSFIARVLIKKRPEFYIVRLSLYTKDGKDLGHYATDVKTLEELDSMKLGGAPIAEGAQSTVRAWLKVSR